MKFRFFLLISLVLLAMTACSVVEAGEIIASGEETDTETTSNVAESADESGTSLSTDYDNALDEAGQLAIGTLVLEQGELAVTVEQAEILLPLWQALQSLSNNDISAAAEIDAVVNQIARNMSEAQISEIASLQLTTESFGEMIQSGQIQLGRGAAPGEGQADGNGRGFGGPPPGGLAGGPGGGAGGPGGADLSEDEIATRRAERFGEGGGDANTGFMSNAVIALLSAKTGVEVDNQRGTAGPTAIIFETVAVELGISIEEIQVTGQSGDLTLAEYIEAEGGDVDAIRAAIIAALDASGNFTDVDTAQMADNWLFGAE